MIRWFISCSRSWRRSSAEFPGGACGGEAVHVVVDGGGKDREFAEVGVEADPGGLVARPPAVEGGDDVPDRAAEQPVAEPEGDERRRERAGAGQGEAAQGRGAQCAEGGFGRQSGRDEEPGRFDHGLVACDAVRAVAALDHLGAGAGCMQQVHGFWCERLADEGRRIRHAGEDHAVAVGDDERAARGNAPRLDPALEPVECEPPDENTPGRQIPEGDRQEGTAGSGREGADRAASVGGQPCGPVAVGKLAASRQQRSAAEDLAGGIGDGEAAQRRGTDDDLGEIGAAGRGEVPDDRGGGGSDKDCLGIADGLLDLDRGGVAAPQGRGGDLGLPPALDGEDQVEECDGRGQHRDGNEGQKPLP